MSGSFEETRFPPPGKTPHEDTAAVMRFYKLPRAFPREVLAEARRVPSDVSPEVSRRLDLRQLGLGGASCGPRPEANYIFPIRDEKWSVTFTAATEK